MNHACLIHDQRDQDRSSNETCRSEMDHDHNKTQDTQTIS
jgi:hypothetical protein